MEITNGLTLTFGGEKIRASINESCLMITQRMTVIKKSVTCRFVRNRHYKVRKKDKSIEFNTMLMMSHVLVDLLMVCLKETDGGFRIIKNGDSNDSKYIYFAYPSKDNIEFDCFAAVKNGNRLVVRQRFMKYPTNGRKRKKYIKKMSYQTYPNGKGWMRVDQAMNINCNLMKMILDMIERDLNDKLVFNTENLDYLFDNNE